MPLKVSCHLYLYRLLLAPVEQWPVRILRSPRCQVPVPLLKERVARAVQDRPSNILPKNAAVLVLIDEVLLQPGPQLVSAGMCADPHDAVHPMGVFAFLKQHIDAVPGYAGHIEREREAPKGCKKVV